MALAANATRTTRGSARQAFQIVDAAEMYAGAIAALNSRGHGTAGSRGRLAPMNDANFLQPIGLQLDRKTGDTAASPIVEGSVLLDGFVAEGLSVAGSSAVADIMRLVYMTDDTTFTLTRPTVGIPIGFVVRWITGTTCDVQVFSFAQFVANALAGQGQYTWLVGLVSGNAIGTGNALTGIEMPHHGFITSIYGIVVEPAADKADDYDFNLEIGGTNVTGGVISWDNGGGAAVSAAGTKLAGSAITGTNEFHEGDLLDVESVENNAGTAGLLAIYAEIQPEPGA